MKLKEAEIQNPDISVGFCKKRAESCSVVLCKGCGTTSEKVFAWHGEAQVFVHSKLAVLFS